VELDTSRPSLAVLLDRYQPTGEAEAADLRRARELAGTARDPWRRDLPLHVTASALIVHPETGRVLLRWHQRQQAWLQVGGHGDPGESDPLAIARREAIEETGLADLVPWPDEQLRHLVIVGVPAGKGEPAHQHADLRYFMATRTPDVARAENEHAPLRWLSTAEAYQATSEVNLRESLARLERLLRLPRTCPPPAAQPHPPPTRAAGPAPARLPAPPPRTGRQPAAANQSPACRLAAPGRRNSRRI
jgi:8-oxo-dGTP pyrophosphatase MutT (NUDIX family)